MGVLVLERLGHGTPFLQTLQDPFGRLQDFVDTFGAALHDAWILNLDAYIAHGMASPLLGTVSKKIYKIVRNTLGVSFLCTASILTPPTQEFPSTLTNRLMHLCPEAAKKLQQYVSCYSIILIACSCIRDLNPRPRPEFRNSSFRINSRLSHAQDDKISRCWQRQL
jgi:hypothetical protein